MTKEKDNLVRLYFDVLRVSEDIRDLIKTHQNNLSEKRKEQLEELCKATSDMGAGILDEFLELE